MKRISVFINDSKITYSILKRWIPIVYNKLFGRKLNLLNEKLELKNKILTLESPILSLSIRKHSL
jgi:hypothetical protein